MHLKSLQVFCDIAGCRSFSRAADANGISQSGASQIVQQLEERLGVQLIDRSKRPLVLTPEGRLYYNGCRQLVQSYENLEDELRTMHEEVSGRVTVASIYSVGLSHMSGLVRLFLQRYPKANVRVQFEHPQEVCALVEGDFCDFGVMSFPKGARGLEARLWREEPMAVAVAPQHPLAEESAVSLAALDGLPLIAFDSGLRIRQETDRALAARGSEPEVVMEFDNIETIKRAVEINAGVALLPAPAVERERQLGTLCLTPLIPADQFTRPLGLVLRRGKHLGRTARRFMQMVLDDGQEFERAAETDPRDDSTAAIHSDAASEASRTARRKRAGKPQVPLEAGPRAARSAT